MHITEPAEKAIGRPNATWKGVKKNSCLASIGSLDIFHYALHG